MEELCFVEDNSCIVLEFINKTNKPVAVGFVCWLAKSADEERLQEIIIMKEEVTFFWPKVDIKTSTYNETYSKILPKIK